MEVILSSKKLQAGNIWCLKRVRFSMQLICNLKFILVCMNGSAFERGKTKPVQILGSWLVSAMFWRKKLVRKSSYKRSFALFSCCLYFHSNSISNLVLLAVSGSNN